METTTITPKTFNTKGLSEVEINFLNEVEKLWLSGTKISFNDLMLPAFANAGYLKGTPEAKECLKAWEYWDFIKHPADRNSVNNPVKLTDIFSTIQKEESKGFFYLQTPEYKSYYALPNEDYFHKLDLSVIYDFTPKDFYFKIINDCLWLEYQHIIGSRFIAVIENDFIN